MKMRFLSLCCFLLVLSMPIVGAAQQDCENLKTFTQDELLALCLSGGGPVTKDGIAYEITDACTQSNNEKVFLPPGSSLCMDFTGTPDLLYVEIDALDNCAGSGTVVEVTYDDGTVDIFLIPGDGSLQMIKIPQGVGKTIEKICIQGCETEVCEIRTCCPPEEPPVDNDWKKYMTFDFEQIGDPQPPIQGNNESWVENGFPVQINGNYDFSIKPGCMELNGTMIIDLLECPGIDKIEIDVMCPSNQSDCFGQAVALEGGNSIATDVTSGVTMETLTLNIPPHGNPERLAIDGQKLFICEIRFCINLKVVSFKYPEPNQPSNCNQTWTEDGIPLVLNGTTSCTFQYNQPDGKLFIGSGTALCADLTGYDKVDFIEVDVLDQCGPDAASVSIQYSVNGVSYIDFQTLEGTNTLETIRFDLPAGAKPEKLTINGCETNICEIRICCTPPPDDEWKKYITLEQFDDGVQPSDCEEQWSENGFPMVIRPLNDNCQFQFIEENGNGCLELSPGQLQVDLTSCPGIDRIEIDVVDYTGGGDIRAFAQEAGAILNPPGPVITTAGGAQTLVLDIPSGKNAEALLIQIGAEGGLICDIRFCINQVIATQEELAGLCTEPFVKDGVLYQVNGQCDILDDKLLLGPNAELCVDLSNKPNIAYIEIDLIDFCSGGSTRIEVELEVNGIHYTQIYPIAGTGPESFFIKTPVGATVKKVRVIGSCGETQICEVRICCYPEKACMKLIDFDEANPDPSGACNVLWEEEDCLMYVGEYPGAGCSYNLTGSSLFLDVGCYHLDLDNPTYDICRIEVGVIDNQQTAATLEIYDSDLNLVGTDQSTLTGNFEVLVFDNVNGHDLSELILCGIETEILYVKIFCDDCPDIRIFKVADSPIQTGLYKASQYIETMGDPIVVATGADVTFQAGDYVLLREGFSASSAGNTTFTARIAPCTSVVPAPQNPFVPYEEPTILEETSLAKPTIDDLWVAPNPFTHETLISYSLAKAGNVSIFVYDVNGKLVDQIATNDNRPAGLNQEQYTADKLEDGIYILAVQTVDAVLTQKMMVLRK